MNASSSSARPALFVQPALSVSSVEHPCPDCVSLAPDHFETPCPDCVETVCDDPATCTDECVVVCNDMCPEGVCVSEECPDAEPQASWICEQEGCFDHNDQPPLWININGPPIFPWSLGGMPGGPEFFQTPMPWTPLPKAAPPWSAIQPSASTGLTGGATRNNVLLSEEVPSPYSSASLASSSSIQSHLSDARFENEMFFCEWAGCSHSFSTHVELVTHVNMSHVPLTIPSTAPLPLPTSTLPPMTDAQVLECLWGDCHRSVACTGPQAQWTADPDFELLARHFMQEHLGLPPEVSHVHTMDCGHSDNPNLRFSMPPPSEQSVYQALPTPDMSFSLSSPSNSPTISPSPSISTPETLSSAGGSTYLSCRWEGCTCSYPTSEELTAHITETHVGGGHSSYDCRWVGCDRHGSKSFASKQKVLRHMQAHTGHRPFKCDQCGQFFSEAATLQQHVRRHTNEKPFVCDFPGCGKAFAITGALTIHKRTHNGEKPFKCKYCERSFSESSNLTKHLRVHTGARPYGCPEPGCEKRFARPDQLTRHVSIHEKGRRSVRGLPSSSHIPF